MATPNIELPIFTQSDKPSWMGSWNSAMNKIDTAIGLLQGTVGGIPAQITAVDTKASAAQSAAESAESSASAALSESEANSSAIAGIQSSISGIQSSVSGLDTRVTALESGGEQPIWNFAVYNSTTLTSWSSAMISDNVFVQLIKLSSNSVSDSGFGWGPTKLLLTMNGTIRIVSSGLTKAGTVTIGGSTYNWYSLGYINGWPFDGNGSSSTILSYKLHAKITSISSLYDLPYTDGVVNSCLFGFVWNPNLRRLHLAYIGNLPPTNNLYLINYTGILENSAGFIFTLNDI